MKAGQIEALIVSEPATSVAVTREKAAKADLRAAVRVAQKYYPTVEPHLLESALSVELATHGSEMTEEMIRVVSEVNVGAKAIQKSYERDDVVVGPEFRALWQCWSAPAEGREACHGFPCSSRRSCRRSCARFTRSWSG